MDNVTIKQIIWYWINKQKFYLSSFNYKIFIKWSISCVNINIIIKIFGYIFPGKMLMQYTAYIQNFYNWLSTIDWWSWKF